MANLSLVSETWEIVKSANESKPFPVVGETSKRQILFINRGEIAFNLLPELMVPVPRRAQTSIKKQSYKGFMVDLKFGEIGGMESDFVFIQCCDSIFLKHFLVIADDLASKLDQNENSIEVVRTTIQNWLQFFKNQNQFLDDSQLTGLFGELSFLEEILESRGPRREVLDSWQGPSGDEWDFLLDDGPNRTLAEIKTTVRPKSSISVHGINQLDPKPGFRCLLNVRFVDRVETKEPSPFFQSLPEQILSISQKLDSAPGGSLRPAFWEILHSIGVFEEHFDEYRMKRYKTFQSIWHEVDSHFPSLSRSKLSPEIHGRIERLQYDLIVSGIPETDSPVRKLT